jgi:ABC-type xylose transport system substrate-binding protein
VKALQKPMGGEMFGKVGRSRATLGVAALAGGILSGFGVADSPAYAKDITIGIAMKTHTELRWKFDEEIMRDEAAKLGVKVNFQ